MQVGSLFSGIGGIDLAVRWMGWETRWFSEIDPFCIQILHKHWPDVPNLGDIRNIHNPPYVDILAGGFPCQDISNNRKREGLAGENSGLWYEYLRIINEIHPNYVLIENVDGLRSRGLGVVLGGLADSRYTAEWRVFPAWPFGAEHRRARIWIVAYPESERMERVWPEGIKIPQSLDRTVLPLRNSDGQWEVEPDIRRAPNGLSRGVDAARVKALGNAAVPQCAYYVLQQIDRHRKSRLYGELESTGIGIRSAP